MLWYVFHLEIVEEEEEQEQREREQQAKKYGRKSFSQLILFPSIILPCKSYILEVFKYLFIQKAVHIYARSQHWKI